MDRFGIGRALVLVAVCVAVSYAEQAPEDGGVSTDGATSVPVELTLSNLMADRTFTLPDSETLKGLKEGDLLRIGPNDKLEPAPEAKQAEDTAAGCLQVLRGVAEADTVRAGRLFQALSAPR